MNKVKLIPAIISIFFTQVYAADYKKPMFSGLKKPVDYSKLPQALLNNGEPIDPFCVAMTLINPVHGDGQALTECLGSAKDVSEFMMYTSHVEKGRVAANGTVVTKPSGIIRSCSARYEVQGVLGSRAIVKSSYAHGRYASHSVIIGLIEQKDGKLYNAGTIVHGAESAGGFHGTESLEKGVYRFLVMKSTSDFFEHILGADALKIEYLDNYEKFGWISLETDLNKTERPFKFEVKSVRFKWPIEFGDPETSTKQCLKKTIQAFLPKHQLSIPTEKFPEFRKKLKMCIVEPAISRPKKSELNVI